MVYVGVRVCEKFVVGWEEEGGKRAHATGGGTLLMG